MSLYNFRKSSLTKTIPSITNSVLDIFMMGNPKAGEGSGYYYSGFCTVNIWACGRQLAIFPVKDSAQSPTPDVGDGMKT